MKEERQWTEQDEIAELERMYEANPGMRERALAAAIKWEQEAEAHRAAIRTTAHRVFWTLWLVAMAVVSWKLVELAWF